MNDRRRLSLPASRLALSTLTAVRLALIPILAVSFMANSLVMTVALLTFMFADLFDGMLARQFGADGPRRRAEDSIVDRLAIDACLVGAAVTGAIPVVLVCAFLARDLYCAALCAQMMREREVAIKADLAYRGLNCAMAGWAIAAPFLSSTGRLASAGALFGVSIGVAVDLSRSVRLVRRAPAAVRDCVISATALRRGDVHWHDTSARPAPGYLASTPMAHVPTS